MNKQVGIPLGVIIKGPIKISEGIVSIRDTTQWGVEQICWKNSMEITGKVVREYLEETSDTEDFFKDFLLSQELVDISIYPSTETIEFRYWGVLFWVTPLDNLNYKINGETVLKWDINRFLDNYITSKAIRTGIRT